MTSPNGFSSAILTAASGVAAPAQAVLSLTARYGKDATDLTDGQLTKREDREIWREPEAVGWSYGGTVIAASLLTLVRARPR